MQPKKSWKQVVVMICSVLRFAWSVVYLGVGGLIAFAGGSGMMDEAMQAEGMEEAVATLEEAGMTMSTVCWVIFGICVVMALWNIIYGVFGLRASKPVMPKTTGLIVFSILTGLFDLYTGFFSGDGPNALFIVFGALCVLTLVLAFLIRSDANRMPQPGYGMPMGGGQPPMGGYPQGGYPQDGQYPMR